MCADKFEPDFFNNIAAIAVVLMFTKVVLHRSRRGSGGRRSLAVFHLVTVLSAAAAIWISLWATDDGKLGPSIHTAAWILLAITGVGLFIDIVVEDVGRARGWPIAKDAHES